MCEAESQVNYRDLQMMRVEPVDVVQLLQLLQLRCSPGLLMLFSVSSADV